MEVGGGAVSKGEGYKMQSDFKVCPCVPVMQVKRYIFYKMNYFSVFCCFSCKFSVEYQKMKVTGLSSQKTVEIL